MKRVVHLAFFTISFLACGGSVANDPTGGSGGASSGGGASGGLTGSGSKGSTGNAGQCDGIPECNPGEARIADGAECPREHTCREQSACGVTIRCSQACSETPKCPPGRTRRVDAYPTVGPDDVTVTACGETIICSKCRPCDRGDVEIASRVECPQDASCYERTSCGVTVWCTGP